MKKGTRNLLIAVGIIVLLVLIVYGQFKGMYNRFVMLEENVNKAASDIENVLQRRLDLIPNLVNTVKGYAAHEEEVLTAVTEARARVGSAKTLGGKLEANTQLTSALGRLLVVMENYPNLKANQNFLTLQSQLEGTENRIAVERRRYNEAVAAYNKTVKSFPERIFAGMFGFEPREFFEAQPGAKQAPKVEF
ncbi:MAG: LemA family protein [Chitinivibrionales bacterium]|nr:LemA family protein [Chitinivibrionales bacterium]MBD3396973.1 LemA family protein [Chitinivibrionales bacterium]